MAEANISLGESPLFANLGDKLQRMPDGSYELLDDSESDLIAPEFIEPGPDTFNENLAKYFTAEELRKIGTDIIELFSDDLHSRDGWHERYKEGMELLKTVQDETEDGRRGTRGLTKVRHPLIIEAATDFQARSAPELLPPDGPVESYVVGAADMQRMDQAHRVKGFMNYQVLELEPEYYPDYDQMLFVLPFVGSTFKKTYFDVLKDRVASRYIPAEDFVVNYGTSTLIDSERHTEIIRMSKNKFNRYVHAGFYQKTSKIVEPTDQFIELRKEIEERAPTLDINEGEIVLLEVHLEYELPDFDEAGFEDIALPYIITVEYGTQEVVGIRRNWEEFDEFYQNKQHYTHHKFLPGAGFYGYSLYHAIGGLDKAATGALRSLLDAAAYATLQGGFKLKGRTPAGELEISPGEFVDLDAAVDDVNKAIMALPFKEPPRALFELLMFLTETGRQFATVADQKYGEANQEAPVGTTIALIEQGSKVFSGIHKRLHQAQKEEFRIRIRLNAQFMDEEYPYAVKGEDRTVFKTDFDDRVDVIPVSDPNIFSAIQRVGQAQAMLQMAQADTQNVHDLRAAYSRMYDALRVPNYEEILPPPITAVRMDPVAENMAMLQNKPIRVYPDQNHMAHIAVLDQGFMALPPPIQQAMMSSYTAHRSAHMAELYKIQYEQALGRPLPPTGDLQNPKAPMQGVDPQTDAAVSAAAAQVAQQLPPQLGPPLPTPEGAEENQEGAVSPEVAAAEAESIRMKAQAEIQKEQAKTQSQMQLRQQEAQQRMALKQQDAMLTMEIKKIQAQMDAEIKVLEAQIEANTDMTRLQAEIQAIRERADNDIAIARARAEQQLEAQVSKAEIDGVTKLVTSKMDMNLKKEQANGAEEN